MHPKEILTLTVELATIIALVLAFIQLRGAKEHKLELSKQMNKLEQQTMGLEAIQQSLSTRYLGLFPRYLGDLAELVRQADQEIRILCDYPAYGCFSDAKAFLAYRRAIEDKSNAGVKVYLLCYNEDKRAQFNDEQFPQGGAEWSAWKSKKENHARLEPLLQDYRKSAELAISSVEELDETGFKKLMLAADRKMLDETFSKATNTTEIETFIPIFFWLIDGREAVFSIASLSGEVSEHGFRTVSSDFIIAFKDMWERYARAALTSAVVPLAGSDT